MEKTRRKNPLLDSDDEDEELRLNRHIARDFKTQLQEANESILKSQIRQQKMMKELEESRNKRLQKEALKNKPISKPVPKSRKPASKKAIKEAQDKYVHAVEVEVPLKRKRGRPRKDAPKRELDYSILETVKHLKAGKGMKPTVIANGTRREVIMPEYLKQF